MGDEYLIGSNEDDVMGLHLVVMMTIHDPVNLIAKCNLFESFYPTVSQLTEEKKGLVEAI